MKSVATRSGTGFPVRNTHLRAEWHPLPPSPGVLACGLNCKILSESLRTGSNSRVPHPENALTPPETARTLRYQLS